MKNQIGYLLAADILDEQQYSDNTMKYSWYDSTIRHWLNKEDNSGFYGTAFSEEEKESIFRDIFNDRIGLTYGGDGASSVPDGTKAQLTDYAYARGGMLSAEESRYSEYWLQESIDPGLAGCVNANGEYKMSLNSGYVEDIKWTRPVYEWLGVVPYIELNLANVDVWMTEEEKQEADKLPINTSKPVIKGDLDGNGVVELSDAQTALKAALKIEQLSEEVKQLADINEDDEVTLSDAQAILKMALKIL